MALNKNIFKQNNPESNMKNKRGDTNWVLVSLFVAIAVGVILLIGFTIGWNKFLPFLSRTNVDNVKTACSIACTTNNQFDFCSVERDVRDGTNDAFKSTCNDLATKADYTSRNYGIATCPSISCPA